jgi:hypothetical protein
LGAESSIFPFSGFHCELCGLPWPGAQTGGGILMDLRPILLVIGLLLVPLGLGMLVPALVDSSLSHPGV